MIRRLPVIPTVIVLAAVAVMVWLGFWQLDRMDQKEQLLSRYAAAQSMSAEIPFPVQPRDVEGSLYRRSSIDCLAVSKATSRAGQNAQGESGLAQVVTCKLPGGANASVVLGWSQSPANTAWAGGKVTGWIAPGPRLVADPPLAGLQPNMRPDPANVPNNHLSYAAQWFLFGLVALVIYGLALRKRLAAKGERG